MTKSALIIGIVAIVLATGASLLSPLCVPCLALFLGLAAGYLSGVFAAPSGPGPSAQQGALAGALGGIGALIGQGIGAGINALLVGPQGALEVMRQFGLQSPDTLSYESSYWISLLGSTCCLGLLSIALMAGLGAVGGVLWWQIAGKAQTQSSSYPG